MFVHTVHERARQYHRVKNDKKNKHSETKFVVTRKKTKKGPHTVSRMCFFPIRYGRINVDKQFVVNLAKINFYAVKQKQTKLTLTSDFDL